MTACRSTNRLSDLSAHQFFIRQQNLKLYRSLVAASEAAAAKAVARQKHSKLLAKEVANEPPARKN
jgi:hypothetical protein